MGKNNTLGDRIKSRRQALGLSQSELSKLLSCTQAALSQYENGNREPGLKDLTNIANCLNTTTDYLLGLTDISSNESDIKSIGDYLGLTEASIRKLHHLFSSVKAKTSEHELQNEAKLLSGHTPGEEGYDDDYKFVRTYAFQDLEDYTKTINDFICSSEFSVFISSIKHNLFLERNVYDMLRILVKHYDTIESPVLTQNIAETAYSFAIDGEDNIKRYALNLFDAQNALIDFCRNFTKLEEIKKLEYSEALYKKLHFFLYMSTQSMNRNGNYSIDTLEEELSPIVKEHLPTIISLLSKKN